jgi:hypothetical protein
MAKSGFFRRGAMEAFLNLFWKRAVREGKIGKYGHEFRDE